MNNTCILTCLLTFKQHCYLSVVLALFNFMHKNRQMMITLAHILSPMHVLMQPKTLPWLTLIATADWT